MNKLTKSPLNVARHAFALANEHLPPYAHRFSPKTYTQPQLFVCLVLKTFLVLQTFVWAKNVGSFARFGQNLRKNQLFALGGVG
jgi:hypothetical protein